MTDAQNPNGVAPATTPLVNTGAPEVPKFAHLIASPVRRMVYPSLYGHCQPQLFTDLQKDAVIANELERLTR